jgi:hypothetical protein
MPDRLPRPTRGADQDAGMDPADSVPPVTGAASDDATLLRSAADRLEALAARTTPGDWRAAGLLASRPEVVAHEEDGSTEHVAEARADSAAWILALSPAVAGPLASLLRTVAAGRRVGPAARELAAVLLRRLP